ncbi:MAG: TrbI/VirB10 family protein [Acidobacteriaceae bacterium]|nr:TrbI/VirB10 family protein [Acidobacteriaceae bacterium]
MADQNAMPRKDAAPPLVPDPQGLQSNRLSNRHKRWMFFGVMGVVLLIILANLVSTNPTTTAKPANRVGTPQQQQNPTPAQIRDWENNLKQQEAQLLDETSRHAQQLARERAAQGEVQPMTADDLQRAAALQDAAQARAQFQQTYGAAAGPPGQPNAQKSQLQAEQEQQAYKSLFADNIVRQEAVSPSTPPQAQTKIDSQSSPTDVTSSPDPETQRNAVTGKARKPLDFNPTAQPTFWLPEGTVIEAVLTNRLDGDAVGPVNCMITTDVYLPGTRTVVIPQGARVLGEASKVSSFGQQRLAVAFHRILVPGLRPYSIPLDKEPPGLAQAGEVGLHDKVNNHYFSIFGASLAIGAIGGLAQIGNGFSGFGYDPSVQFRNGVSQSLAESSDRVLDRFLNRMPTVTVREGTRVKILLTDDLGLPAYDSMHTGDM